MRKILMIVISIFIFAGLSSAESWHTANAINVGWDIVEKIVDTDIIKYQLYTMSLNDGDISMYGEEVSTNESVIKFSKEGKYYIGVRAVRYPKGELMGINSESVSWSNDAAVCVDNDIFGVTYYVSPSNVLGIKIIK